MLSHIQENGMYLNRLYFSVATLHVCETVNRYNYHVWGSKSPHDVTEIEDDSPKVNVWCALMRKLLIPSLYKTL
jgi:hypothetical protein